MSQAVAATRKPLISLISDICRKLLENRASLPTMPDVAARIHGAMTSPNWSVSSVASIIKGDPGTTAFLLQIANSALYMGVTPVRDVDRAITRLGIANTRNLVMAHTLRSMFVTRSDLLASAMRRTWQKSARLAALSAVLARHCSRYSPERALLAGLMQDVGVLPILQVLKRYQEQLTDEAQVLAAVDRYAARVGEVLLEHWGFEPDLVEVAMSRCDWFRDSGRTADLADLVLLARLHDCAAQEKAEDLPRIDTIPAASKLPIGEVLEDGSLALLRAEESSVAEIVHVLGAAA